MHLGLSVLTPRFDKSSSITPEIRAAIAKTKYNWAREYPDKILPRVVEDSEEAISRSYCSKNEDLCNTGKSGWYCWKKVVTRWSVAILERGLLGT